MGATVQNMKYILEGVRKNSPEVDGLFGDLIKGISYPPLLLSLPLPSLSLPSPPPLLLWMLGGHGSFTGKKEGSVGAPCPESNRGDFVTV